ncbi:CBS domain-containing protein [Micromonospora inositola]|uniref:CBS domain-containing protein n=1 Tax=Micromonospora inositola TaxID=47865 RepID=A0A1C5JQI4_9ACTN|nr:CBS domain-containing protein [Micromonospora inositola]SCG72489.1 CBS domain-containing protein [Micromonospora inositola]
MASAVDIGLAADVRREGRTPEFLRVSLLVPDDQDVVTVPTGTPIGSAIDLMRRHDFDQLPVMTVNSHVVGTFTYRSFSQGLRHLRAQDDPLSMPVEDLVEDLRFVRAADEVSAVLGYIETDRAVLVGDEDRLLAVVTAADVSAFLWRRTRPFVLLQDIELAVRDLMRSSCTDEDLASVVSAALPGGNDERAARLEDLTLSELFTVLLHGTSFGRFFRTRFGNNRHLVRATLEPVREIRNKVFHFRDELSAEELQRLLDVASWLRRKILIRGGAR